LHAKSETIGCGIGLLLTLLTAGLFLLLWIPLSLLDTLSPVRCQLCGKANGIGSSIGATNRPRCGGSGAPIGSGRSGRRWGLRIEPAGARSGPGHPRFVSPKVPADTLFYRDRR